jgi:predicted O-methyltransferase YrrM
LFSQSNEDEVIAQIFSLIGTTNKRFVEFGSGDGRQNNTIQLLLDGWSGIWCEPHRRRYQSAKERWAKYPVEIKRRVVTPEKVNLLVKDPLDFLSIDIDGNDYAVWEALTARPRLVCIEYVWVGPEAMEALGKKKGYEFVCFSASQVNGFFVAT